MLDLRSLRYFVCVAEQGSVGRAAVLLNISASPLSRAIRGLEQEVGFPLFDRVGRGLRLNIAGRELLENARALLQSNERLARDLRRRSSGDGGLVVLGHMPGSLYNGVLPRAIRRLRQTHPAIQVSFEVMHEEAQIEAIRNGRLDLCVQTAPEGIRDLTARVFARERYVLIVPQDHALARVPELGVQDLAEAEWLITPDRGHPSLRNKFLMACEELGFTPRIAYVAGDMVSALALVANGLGVCVAQAGLAQFADSRICVRPLPFMRMETVFSILWRPDALSPSAARLLDALTEEPPG
jgi:DNA-binding transcriptional LysR family regulator